MTKILDVLFLICITALMVGTMITGSAVFGVFMIWPTAAVGIIDLKETARETNKEDELIKK